MPRVCNQEGCGQRLVAKDGSSDYRRHFCGPECLRIDKRERMQSSRRRLKNGRCRRCGRKAALDALPNDRVKPHNTARSERQNSGEDEVLVGKAESQEGSNCEISLAKISETDA
jgi:hypothetical protein